MLSRPRSRQSKPVHDTNHCAISTATADHSGNRPLNPPNRRGTRPVCPVVWEGRRPEVIALGAIAWFLFRIDAKLQAIGDMIHDASRPEELQRLTD